MNWRAFIRFSAMLFFLIIGLGAISLVQRPSTMTLFFTGDTQGYLVPCGCKIIPAGGLARRASALEKLRAISEGRVVPVEVTHGFADRGPGREILNRQMGRFFAREGALVGLGSYDLLLGPEALRMAAPGVPLYVCGRGGYPGSVDFRLGGWGIGPFGDRGARLRLVFLAETAPGGVKMSDPVAALRAEVAAHPAEGYVVAGQLSTQSLAAILKEVPNLVAVVAQWQTQVTTTSQQAGETLVTYIGDRGRRCATLRVTRSEGRWKVEQNIEYLGPNMPSDKMVEKEVLLTLDQVARVNAEALSRLSSPPKKGGAYLGSGACKACHAKAHEAWAPSRHASASRDLAIDHQEQNPDCLRCHSTGMGQPGGFPQPSLDLSGVQCEACHGPGEGHPPKPMRAAPPSRESCGPCHGTRDSPTFNPDGYWKLVKHG